ncbi:ABC transporter permease [Parablautia muri]|uniref:ABC transporter permease n=1 Tax=Parablautia muri TaxID=2320879 RepID=A0A9X5GSE4_9FIRM|nr:ABC transporter permease [Parablautia muri]NBJ92875.1 ABC transporter permease [Parablautia muri]
MYKYVLKRLLWMIVIMLGVTFVIFTITYFIPGDPARTMLGSTATDAEVAAMRKRIGLDQPYFIQLVNYFSSVLRLDFGTSWSYDVSVSGELLGRLPVTILVGGLAMLIQVIIGIPLGVFAAVNQSKWQDNLSMAISMILVSVPDFWVALMMIVLFSVKLGWLPPMGINNWKCFIMPVIAAGIGGIAANARQTRSSMLEVFRADFVVTARAKGQKEKKVIWKHMFPNALMPIITMVIGGLGRIVGGTAVIETIFTIPGCGLYLLDGINGRDYPVIRGSTIILALFSAFAVLLMDIAYAYVDPRIKAQYISGK